MSGEKLNKHRGKDTRDTKNSIWHKKRESIMLPGKQGTCAALPANETIAALAEKYPRCFALLETKRRPLANRIHDALLATVAPDERGTILFALRIYTSNMRYLARCVENAPRIDLSGKIAGRTLDLMPVQRSAVPVDNRHRVCDVSIINAREVSKDSRSSHIRQCCACRLLSFDIPLTFKQIGRAHV